MLHKQVELTEQFCKLVQDKKTTPEQVRDFLSEYMPVSQYKSFIEMRDKDGHFPIEFVTKHGNADVLKYLDNVLGVSLEIPHPDHHCTLLDLCVENPDTRDYLLNPENRTWQRLGSDIKEIHIAACAGDMDRIRHLLKINPESFLSPTEDNKSVLHFLHRFSHRQALLEMLAYIRDRRNTYESKQHYLPLAATYTLYSYFEASRHEKTSFIKSLEYGDRALKVIEKGKQKSRNPEHFVFYFSLIHLHMARIYQIYGDEDNVLCTESIDYHRKKAEEADAEPSFSKTPHFNAQLIPFYLHRFEVLEHRLEDASKETDFNFIIGKTLIAQLRDLNDIMLKLYQKIPHLDYTPQLLCSREACEERNHDLLKRLVDLKIRFNVAEPGELPVVPDEKQDPKFGNVLDEEIEKDKAFRKLAFENISKGIKAYQHYENLIDNETMLNCAHLSLREAIQHLRAMQETYHAHPELECNLLDNYFKEIIADYAAREAVLAEITHLPAMDFSSERKTDSLVSNANPQGSTSIAIPASYTPAPSSSIVTSSVSSSPYNPGLFKGEPDEVDLAKRYPMTLPIEAVQSGDLTMEDDDTEHETLKLTRT